LGGSLTIYKYGSDGTTPLKGAKFNLVGVQDSSVTYTGETDENGKLVFEDIYPQTYILTELATNNDYELLTDSIEVTIPFEVTLSNANKVDDLSKAVFDPNTKTWCFYDLTYTIGNNATFDMPMSGGAGFGTTMWIASGVLALGVGALYLSLRKKRRENDK
jgi:uncharacterized surface anchored protein